VGHIDYHSQPIHSANNLIAEIAQAFVVSVRWILPHVVADLVITTYLRVAMDKGDHSDAQMVKFIQSLNVCS
jgi:type III secretory pathway component EscR